MSFPSVLENQSLRAYNTFGVAVTANYFTAISSYQQLFELLDNTKWKKNPILILGGGSNILFTKNFEGLVVKNEINGIEKIAEDDQHIYIKVAAGENWHSFVMHCVENGWAGVENLSLIPGCVGASPMQNIGAYGVEIKDVFHQLEAFHIKDQKIYTFNLNDCEFGYRESVFKQRLKNQFIITSVTFRVHKKAVLHTDYGAIEQELEKMKIATPTIKSVSDAVIRIRSSKLPDPTKLGNAGSFFKNPIIDEQKFMALKTEFPNIVGYASKSKTVKVAAGWLIEACGWKGRVVGNCGVHKDQALVLVNYGQATGAEIYELSSQIINSVESKFSITLQREVNIL